MSPSSLALPPPRNWQDFEDLCCDLWRRLWADPDAQKNGRSGQPQAGVDVFGRPGRGSGWAGLQCKLMQKSAKLSRAILEREVERARAFSPALSSFLIATTLPRDISAQEIAREITVRQLECGSFPITVYAWDDIQRELSNFPELLGRHYPQFFPLPSNRAEKPSTFRDDQSPPQVGSGARHSGAAPPMPKLIIGRLSDVQALKDRLKSGAKPQENTVQSLTVIRGWPGVGKTTLISALAHDPEVNDLFPDGVLWASLGQEPNIIAELAIWGLSIGINIKDFATIEAATVLLTEVLRNQRRLLLIDDVWDAQHLEPFRVGGQRCSVLVTTRLPEVAREISPTASDVYNLNVLSDHEGLRLLETLSPKVTLDHRVLCEALVRDLEGLPLALQVAGRLLQAERGYGFGVASLLEDIRAGARIIEARAPSDRSELSRTTSPTVAALLQKSTDLLDDDTRTCFTSLAPFAPKPATFDAEAMEAVWGIGDPAPTIRELVDHGLLEPVDNSRYWMHALLVAHARALLLDKSRS